MSWLITADRAKLDSSCDIFHTHNLGMLQPEQSAVVLPRRRVFTYDGFDGIDDDLVGAIPDTMDVLG